jgi:hypothetical protein
MNLLQAGSSFAKHEEIRVEAGSKVWVIQSGLIRAEIQAKNARETRLTREKYQDSGGVACD